jgi:hypothetical protein
MMALANKPPPATNFCAPAVSTDLPDFRVGSIATDGFRACAAQCPLLLQERSFKTLVRNDATGQQRT